jgi:O-acetyl-ADP-ribose deacetylase (regulator of RNase III)
VASLTSAWQFLVGDPSRATLTLGDIARRLPRGASDRPAEQQTNDHIDHSMGDRDVESAAEISTDGVGSGMSDEKAAWDKLKDIRSRNLRGYRIPVQVCPRGCGYSELARRDLLAKTDRKGRAHLHTVFSFETESCPHCGAPLTRICARCEEEILAPVVDRCRFCGLPQPWASSRRAGAERASIRLWRAQKSTNKRRTERTSEHRANDPALPVYECKGRSRSGRKKAKKQRGGGDVWVIDGDIASLAVDAVVSNDDVDGQMWSQVASAIKNAAGEGVEHLAQQDKPFRLGYAWLTDPGALTHMKGIIHVASMTRHGKSTVGTIRTCLRTALELADELEYHSLGLGAFGSGPAANAVDIDEWFQVFADVTAAFLLERPAGRPLSIVLVLFEPAKLGDDVAKLRHAFAHSWAMLGSPKRGRPKAVDSGLAAE